MKSKNMSKILMDNILYICLLLMMVIHCDNFAVIYCRSCIK